jgi:NDP-sugar pyrophosphorylase family protein
MSNRADLGIWGGVIAAGDGRRLRADGYRMSKPMVPVAGRPLMELALERFRAAGIRRLTIIINESSDDCRQWLQRHAEDFDLDLIVRTTPSSCASFQVVADRLAGGPSVITTVDAVVRPDDFRTFVLRAAALPDDAMALGLTEQVDDENPLWAALGPDGRIRQLGGPRGTHVTAGLYWLPKAPLVQPPVSFPRLRDYLGWLVTAHERVHGIVLPTVFDVDRASDIVAVEAAEVSRAAVAGANERS